MMLKQLLNRKRRLILSIVVVVVVVILCLLYVGRHSHGSAEKLPLFRDLYTQEVWPDIQGNNDVSPEQVPRTVHYLWCGEKQFRFQHYLSLLSAIRLLQPLQVVFHYTHLPVTDSRWYNVWFQELKQSVASLELKQLETIFPCGSTQLLDTVIGFLAHNGGGFYLGETVILTRFPSNILESPFWFHFSNTTHDVTQGMVYSRHGFNSNRRAEYMEAILSTTGNCSSLQNFNQLGLKVAPPCLSVTQNIYPREFWADSSPFAEFARWLFYGRRQMLIVKQTQGSSIPRVGHITWLSHEGTTVSREFKFLHFLSVLSALHVAGLNHVYVHGDLPPWGVWWERLEGENVTFVYLDAPQSVFQQKVQSLSHRSDILRMHILHKHGGVYQDTDTVWVSRLPDWLLQYPTVMCPDWPRNGEWPESFNTGVLMSQPDAPFLRHFLFTLRHFLDYDHAFNAVMMPYRTYERYPDTVYIDRYLQVICFRGICHPVWHDDYLRDIDDVTPPRAFDWQQARAFHFTVPKPPATLTSPEAIITGAGDMIAEIGHHILKMSGRAVLINEGS